MEARAINRYVGSSPRKMRLVVLDACRANPFIVGMRKTRATRSLSDRGLMAIEPVGGTLVVYAAKAGALAVSFDLPTLPGGGYSPLKQEGGLGLGEGGAGDSGGSGGFSEGAVIAGETTDATDEAIQKSIVSVYGK